MNDSAKEDEVDLVIVDDDELTLELLQRRLRNSNVKLRCFTDEVSALSYLRRQTPRVLIVDQRMPRIDGIDFLEQLTNGGYVAPEQMYLCSSATPPDEIIARARRAGANQLSKDIFLNTELLLELISVPCPGQMEVDEVDRS